MAVNIGDVEGTLRLRDQFTAVLRAAQGEVEKFSTTFSGGLSDVAATSEKAKKGVEGVGTSVSSAGKDVEEFGNIVGRMGERLIAAFALREIAGFVGGVASSAQSLRNLGLETGISVEQLQIFGAVTKERGIDADQLGRAINQMSIRIAGGDASAASAVHELGMSLSDLRGLAPDQLFTTLLRAIDAIPDPLEKARIAAELFGTRIGGALIGVAHNFDEAVAKARQFNTIMTSEAVEAAAKAADNWDRMGQNIKATAGIMLGPAFEGLNVVAQGAQNGATKWDLFNAAVADFATSWLTWSESAKHVADVLDQVAHKGHDIELIADRAANSPGIVTPEQTLAAIKHDNAVANLTATQRHYLDALNEANLLNEKTAASFHVSAAQLDAYRKEIEQAAKAEEERAREGAKAETEANAVIMTAYQSRVKVLAEMTAAHLKAYSFEGQIAELKRLDAAEQAYAVIVEQNLTSETDRARVREEASKRHVELQNQEMALQVKHAAVVNADVVAELEAQSKINAAYGRRADGTIAVTTAAEQLRIKIDALNASDSTWVGKTAQIQALTDELTKSLLDEAAALTIVVGGQKADNDELAKVPALKKAASDAAMHSMGFAGEAIPTDILASIKGMDSLSGGAEARRQMNMRLPTFDVGGPVTQDGPIFAHAGEYVVPKDGGGMMAPSVTNHFYINGSIKDLAQPLMAEITRSLKMGRLLPSN